MITNNDILIHYKAPIIEALKSINNTQKKALICIDDQKKLVGILTDGDIRRGLIRNLSVNDRIEKVMNTSPLFVTQQINRDEADSLVSDKIRILPVVDFMNKVIGYYAFKEKYESRYIKNKSVTILGMGYVGLTLGLVLADVGFKVYGFDINQKIIEGLLAKEIPFYEVGLEQYLEKLANISLKFTSDPTEAKGDIYIITVGTPLIKNTKEPNINHIQKAIGTIGTLLEKGDLVILRSTVPIGCTREIVIPILEKKSGLECGTDFYISFAPERTAEGVALKELRINPQIIGAFDRISCDLSLHFFQTITNTIIDVGSLEAAETCKLMDNTYRDHIFAYSNYLAMLTERLGLNINRLIDAVNFGYTRTQIPKPSPGVGGPCLSKDPYILASAFEKHRLNTDLLLITRKINEQGPEVIKDKLVKLLKEAGKSIESAKISLIGLAFKGHPETSDLRDSTSLWLLNLLPSKKNIKAYDPVINSKEINKLGVESVDLEGSFKDADAVIILNNHLSYKKMNISNLFDLMNKPAVFIDTWYNFDPLHIKQYKNIIYGGIGNG